MSPWLLCVKQEEASGCGTEGNEFAGSDYLLFEAVVTELRVNLLDSALPCHSCTPQSPELHGIILLAHPKRWWCRLRAGSPLVRNAGISNAPGGAGSVCGSSSGHFCWRCRLSLGTCFRHLQREGRREPARNVESSCKPALTTQITAASGSVPRWNKGGVSHSEKSACQTQLLSEQQQQKCSCGNRCLY